MKTASIILIALILAGCAGAPYYTAAPFSARVIDHQTKQPIAGAVVVANWELVTGSWGGARHIGQLEVRETVTDQEGRFSFQGFSRLNPGLSELRDADPRVLVFKGGYRPQTYFNSYPEGGTQTPGIHRKSAVDGQDLELWKAEPIITGPGKDTLKFYGGLSADIGNIVSDCQWPKIPRLLKAMDEEKRRIKKEYPTAIVDIGIENIAIDSKETCKLTSESLKEYLR